MSSGFIYVCIMCETWAALSHSIVSDSLWPQWTVAHHAPLSMGILQARILEWVAMPSSKGSSQPRDQTLVSCIAGEFFTLWVRREACVKLNWILFCCYICNIFVHSFICWWTLGLLLYLLAFVNMLLWTWVYKYLFESLLLIVFWCVPRSGIAGSSVNSIFKFLRNHNTAFHSSCTVVHSHSQSTSFPISPYSSQSSCFLFCFFETSHLNGCGFDLYFPNN